MMTAYSQVTIYQMSVGSSVEPLASRFLKRDLKLVPSSVSRSVSNDIETVNSCVKGDLDIFSIPRSCMTLTTLDIRHSITSLLGWLGNRESLLNFDCIGNLSRSNCKSGAACSINCCVSTFKLFFRSIFIPLLLVKLSVFRACYQQSQDFQLDRGF